MTDKQLILALRQCEHFKLSGHCEKCEYEMFASCDRRLCAEASLRIEKLLAENEALRKEIEWKDMVIATAQKKQTEAEYERDLLREELTEVGEWNG